MKFSDIEEAQWPELKPYLDTILLPITGLSGVEEPWEATRGLEELRDLIDASEGQFRGRIVVYPAYHYISESRFEEEMKAISGHLRAQGFAYMIMAVRGEASLHNENNYCDLLLSYSDYEGMNNTEMKKDVQGKIVSLWQSKPTSSNM